MIKLIVISILITVSNVSSDSTEDLDPVIDYLLNGRISDVNIESAVDNEPSEGIWKCGNCSDLGNPYLMDVYDDDDDYQNDGSVEKKIQIHYNKMRCVTVSSATKGVVHHVTGSCAGPEVTLTLATSKHFIIRVYE